MDKAIKKGSIVIQKHSMKIKGKEYCKWIDDNYFLVGKAYFYKGEFDEAIKTFSFIKNEYKDNLPKTCMPLITNNPYKAFVLNNQLCYGFNR